MFSICQFSRRSPQIQYSTSKESMYSVITRMQRATRKRVGYKLRNFVSYKSIRAVSIRTYGRGTMRSENWWFRIGQEDFFTVQRISSRGDKQWGAVRNGEPVGCIRCSVPRRLSRSNRAFFQDRVYVIRAPGGDSCGKSTCTHRENLPADRARSIFPYLIHARQTREH